MQKIHAVIQRGRMIDRVSLLKAAKRDCCKRELLSVHSLALSQFDLTWFYCWG